MITPLAESSTRAVLPLVRRLRLRQLGLGSRSSSPTHVQVGRLSSTAAVHDPSSDKEPGAIPGEGAGSEPESDSHSDPITPSPDAGSEAEQGSSRETAPRRGHTQHSSWANDVVVNARANIKAEDERRLRSGVGLSRDMSESAESSKGGAVGSRASRRSNEMNEENKQFAELFDTLREKWTKTSSSPSLSEPPAPQHPQSITSRLSFSPFTTPSPRKGVHARNRRSAGQTPKEADAFNQILAGIFADLEPSPAPRARRPSSSPSGISDPYAATRGGGFGLGGNISDRTKAARRFFERDEVDDESVEELEMLKEEMAFIPSDVELLEWAKNRVFKPVPPIDDASTSTSTSNLPPMLTFAPTYPKILAHLLRTIRVNYNDPHLVLALFQHAQTSSLESYLSGCLTGAYNEVLAVRWESFRDLTGLENGIREMEMVGVNWDAATARLVSKAVEEVSRELLPSPSQSQSQNPWEVEAEVDAAQGFGSLASLTGAGGGKYGPEVLERLGRLEKKVQKDVRAQERMFENMQKKKRRAREERERRLERERREGGGEYAPDDLESQGDKTYL